MAFARPKKLQDEASLYEYAVAALGRRMRPVAELKRLLRRRVVPGELGDCLVEMVIIRLKDQKYLSDSNYAAMYSSLRRDNQKFGRRRVITELKTRGVHAEVIEEAVAGAFDGVNEETQARQYLRRKRLHKPTNDKESARIFRALIRAGFGTRTIFSVLKKWDVDDEVLSALEAEQE